MGLHQTTADAAVGEIIIESNKYCARAVVKSWRKSLFEPDDSREVKQFSKEIGEVSHSKNGQGLDD